MDSPEGPPLEKAAELYTAEKSVAWRVVNRRRGWGDPQAVLGTLGGAAGLTCLLVPEVLWGVMAMAPLLQVAATWRVYGFERDLARNGFLIEMAALPIPAEEYIEAFEHVYNRSYTAPILAFLGCLALAHAGGYPGTYGSSVGKASIWGMYFLGSGALGVLFWGIIGWGWPKALGWMLGYTLVLAAVCTGAFFVAQWMMPNLDLSVDPNPVAIMTYLGCSHLRGVLMSRLRGRCVQKYPERLRERAEREYRRPG